MPESREEGTDKKELNGEKLQMKTVLCLRHVKFEDLGSFEPVLEAAGYSIVYQDAGIDDFKSLDAYAPDLIIVLGGPVGVYQSDIYPFLDDEVTLLERRLAVDLPTLGICLGSQLVARALGASVYPGKVKEIGWAPLTLSDAGRESCLSELLMSKPPSEHIPEAALAAHVVSDIVSDTVPVLHWHGDTFDLPRGATHLASTAGCRNQAFSWGRHGLALQFHPEVTRLGLESWLIGHSAEIAATPGVSANILRKQTAEMGTALRSRSKVLMTRWLSLLPA